MQQHDFINDIPVDVARRAHSGTSHVPEQRAVQEREGYASQLFGDYMNLLKLIENKPDMASVLETEFSRYRDGMRQRTIDQLNARSRCMSTMITGASNFPTRRNQKRNNTADKRAQELIDFRSRALDAIRKTLCPELRPIMLGDADADTRLKEKIEKAEKLQQQMRDCNAAIRKHKKAGAAAQVAALVALGLDELHAKELLKPDFCGRIGFADYQLTNNNANIKRMKGRLTLVERTHSEEKTEFEGEHATFEDCPAENRVRLFYPGKPSEEIRTKLKSKGFRWTPSIGAWQAYRHDHTIALAKEMAGEKKPDQVAV